MKSVWQIKTEHRLATILHPKLKNFESCHDEKENAVSALKLAFDKYHLNNSSSSIYLLNSSQIRSSSSSTTDVNTSASKNKNLLTQYFDRTVNTDVNVKSSNPHKEIDDYLNSEYCPAYYDNNHEHGDIDVLNYWKEKQNIFPVLSSLAEQVFAIPASNTIIERLFSASKNTVTEKRTNLASEKINQLLFLQKNYALLKQLFHENKRKRTISMSSTTTMSSEDSTCTMPKQPRMEDEDSFNITDDIDISFD
jgi:hypothetical protein